MADMVIVSSKLKAWAKEKGMRTSGDFLDKLNERVIGMMEMAVWRAQQEKVGTLKDRHA